MATATAMLSHLVFTVRPRHCLPHTAGGGSRSRAGVSGTSGSSDIHASGVVRAAVGSAVEFYFSQGIAWSTTKWYDAVWKKYVGMCNCMG